MNKLKYILILSLITNLCFGQERVFDKYDFDSSDYILIGTWGHSDKNGLQDTLQEFNTADKEILKEFKEVWVFDKTSPFWACGYHYFLHICKSGKSVEEFAINLNCNMISTSNGYFFFDSEKLRRFVGRLDKPKQVQQNFKTIEEGRDYIDSVLKQTNLILTPIPDWVEYEGEFQFVYPCTDLKRKESCFDKSEDILEKITNELKDKFPNEQFDLYESGGSTDELYITVKSNKSLADRFDLYELTWKKWDDYKPYLRTWWIRE